MKKDRIGDAHCVRKKESNIHTKRKRKRECNIERGDNKGR